MPVCHQNVQSDGNGKEKSILPLRENYSEAERFSIFVSADRTNQRTRKREVIADETKASSEHSNLSPGQTSQTDQSS